MEKVFPLRFYGDGADTIGLNAFELLTMISVAPKHSSTLKTRFVFHGFVSSVSVSTPMFFAQINLITDLIFNSQHLTV